MDDQGGKKRKVKTKLKDRDLEFADAIISFISTKFNLGPFLFVAPKILF